MATFTHITTTDIKATNVSNTVAPLVGDPHQAGFIGSRDFAVTTEIAGQVFALAMGGTFASTWSRKSIANQVLNGLTDADLARLPWVPVFDSIGDWRHSLEGVAR